MGNIINEYFADFKNGDYALLVRFMEGGWRCGYIGVSSNSPLFGLAEDEYFGDFIPHGGITFSGHLSNNNSNTNINTDYWYFGFDCAHIRDANDIESRKSYFPDSSLNDLPNFNTEDDIVWTEEMVISELIEWLIDVLYIHE